MDEVLYSSDVTIQIIITMQYYKLGNENQAVFHAIIHPYFTLYHSNTIVLIV